MNVAMLVIGNELLSGKVFDLNTQHAAKSLQRHGHKLCKVVTVNDDRAIIAHELTPLRQAHDAVITSGGIGVTHDDVTIEAVAQAFDVPVVRSAEVEAYFRKRAGPHTPERLYDLANIPMGANLIYPSKDSNTKAQTTEAWPVVQMNNVYLLPGVPPLFAQKLEYLLALWEPGAPIYSRTVHSPFSEPTIAPLLDVLAKEFDDVSIGSYPQWEVSEHPVKVTFDGPSAERVHNAADKFTDQLASIK